MTTRQNEWKVIGRGIAGWHAQGDTASSSGGDLFPYIYWTGQPCDGYAREAVEGCPIYDASRATAEQERQFAAWVYQAPCVNTSLAPGQAEIGYVSVATQLAGLRAACPWVRFGRVEAGAVRWEDGEVVPLESP